jgi:hypothetical protein
MKEVPGNLRHYATGIEQLGLCLSGRRAIFAAEFSVGACRIASVNAGERARDWR